MKQTRRLRIAIVGSGSAGPAVAAFLARENHEVTLYEQAPVKQAVGAGFLIQPTGLAVLKHLGVLEKLLPQASKVNQLFCKTTSDRTLLDLHYEDLEPGIFGAGTHRSTLLDILLKQAEVDGASIQWNTEIKSINRTKRSNSYLLDSTNKKHGPFDLVLISNGARSSLRSQLNIPTKVSTYPWGALWFIGKRTSEFSPNTLWQCVDSTDVLTGYLPTGTKDDLLSLFWSARVKDFEHIKKQPINLWKQDVMNVVPHAEAFLDQIESTEQLQSATYFDVRMKRWHFDGVVVLGDAAHALSPQLGQGVNLALMDAYTLAECIKERPLLQEALPEYTKRRRQHTQFYQFATRWTTPFFQSDFPLLGLLRDTAFPIANTIPWTRKQMTMTMAGFKTGVLRNMKIAAQDN